MFETAKWIWPYNGNQVDDYAEFNVNFETKSEKALLRISCDSIYAIYLNGNLIKFMECSDFPNDKFYDEIEIETLKNGNNILIDVWHYGKDSQKYINANAGLIFEIIENKNVVCCSDENTPSRTMNEFKNGYKKAITKQQGDSFLFDFNQNKTDFSKSVVVEKKCKFTKREIHPLLLKDRINPSLIKIDNKHYLVDLKEEVAGLPDIDIVSKTKQKIIFAYGEHLKDKQVRRFLSSGADFSFEINAKEGRNTLLNPLKRIAGRYIEVFAEEEIEINYVGIRPVMYEHKIIPKSFKDNQLQQIYDMCIRTLECCMHEHYEDCPWREQCLYTMDSRNQMLCGSYAFEGYEYQKHIILLFSKCISDKGLFTICAPSGLDYPIPSFSLVYFQLVYEYTTYSKDLSILPLVKETLDRLLNKFFEVFDKEKNLLKHFPTPPYWNFYEWCEESSSANEIQFQQNEEAKHQYDLILNAMFVSAINYYNKLFKTNYNTENIVKAIHETFYLEKEKVYRLHTNTNKYSQLGNALAYSIGLGDDDLLDEIINNQNMIQASLSMRGFVYDSLILRSKKYYNFVIEDIKTRYQKMLDDGATTCYETDLGADDFAGCGSLCHGWSAIPIIYFNKLL